jgi:hypothetical protein
MDPSFSETSAERWITDIGTGIRKISVNGTVPKSRAA